MSLIAKAEGIEPIKLKKKTISKSSFFFDEEKSIADYDFSLIL